MSLSQLARSVWTSLPLSWRQSRLVQRLKRRLRPRAAADATVAASATPIRTVSTLEELDEALKHLDQLAAISDEELRRGFHQFHMRFPLQVPEDPDSAAYRENQWKLYEWLHGKPYSVEHESTRFDIQEAATSPFPYHTQGAQTVGNHLIGIGHLIRTMNLPAGNKILELGPGWGNTTLELARMGYQVTAIDIEKNFVDLIHERARRKGLAVEVHQGDFASIADFARQKRSFDAVLFFECFHHCADHQRLVGLLDAVVAPGGQVVFAAEPITDDFPLPWGLRLDGESLWAIRKHGWLELGFQEKYFRQLLGRHGWELEKSVCSETPWGVVFTARRRSG